MIHHAMRLAAAAAIALAAEAPPLKPMVINILRDGTLRAAGREMTKKELSAVVKAALLDGRDRKFLIRADRRARHGDVAAVFALLNESGVKEVDIAFTMRPGKQTKVKNGYAWKRTPTTLALTKAGKVVWQLNYDKKEGKPYFHPLCTTDGTLLTALRPKDHPWHRALWFSWKFINGLNYWEEDRRGLSQGRTEITSVKIAAKADHSARIDMTLSYHPPDKPVLLTEKRTMSVSAPDAAGVYRIEWKSTFTAGQKDVFLDRTPIKGEKGGKGWGGYAGLSLRLAPGLRKWPAVDSEGRRDMKIHGQQAAWMGFGEKAGRGGIFVEAGKSSLGLPPWYISKGMPYFSPAVLFARPFTLKAGKSIAMAYTITIYPAKGGK